MSEWKVELRGDRFDLEELPRHFPQENVNVVEEEGKFFLRSARFTSLGTCQKVYDEAAVLLERINGTMRISIDNFRPTGIEAVIYVDDQGVSHRNVWLRAEAGEYRMKGADISLVYSHEDLDTAGLREPATKFEESWPEIANHDKNVAKVLRFFSQELDWIVLYKILDVLLEDQGGGIFDKEWAGEKEINLFTHTANSYGAIGDAARHAQETKKFQPPPTPMTLSQAQALIRSIVNKWLEEKASCTK